MEEDEKVNDLEKRIWQDVCQLHMFHKNSHVLTGVSGGADSVALLHILTALQKTLGFQLTVVHVEHGIRGQESLEDAQFVEQLCERLQVPLITEHVDVPAYAKQQKLTEEEAARVLRYRIFEQIAEKIGAESIAVAHHANDQAETVLMNLARGAALRGAGGIRPVNGKIVRPLLGVTRAEIEQYLREKALSWKTDSTNLETQHTRNRMRLHILPMLEEQVNEKAVLHICESARRLQEVEEYMRRQAAMAANSCVYEIKGAQSTKGMKNISVRVDLSVYQDMDKVLKPYVLQEAIARITQERSLKDIGAVHIHMLEDLAEKDCGASVDLPAGIRGFRDADALVLEQMGCSEEIPVECVISRDGEYVIGNRIFHVKRQKKPVGMPPENQYTKWLAYDTIKGAICIRTRKAGDYLVVNDAGGRKKLKDYLIDQKIPRRERDHVLLVAQGNHILWVVGWRISETAKITDRTKEYLEIECRGKE